MTAGGSENGFRGNFSSPLVIGEKLSNPCRFVPARSFPSARLIGPPSPSPIRRATGAVHPHRGHGRQRFPKVTRFLYHGDK